MEKMQIFSMIFRFRASTEGAVPGGRGGGGHSSRIISCPRDFLDPTKLNTWGVPRIFAIYEPLAPGIESREISFFYG